MRIDGNEKALAARQNISFSVDNLSHVFVSAAPHTKFPRLDTQGLIQGHGPQIVNGDLFGERDHLAEFVHFTHRLIQYRRNNAAVGVSGRPSVTFAQAKAADEAVALFVVGELQAHALGIVLAASEAEVFLQANILGAVAAASGFLGHVKKLNHKGH